MNSLIIILLYAVVCLYVMRCEIGIAERISGDLSFVVRERGEVLIDN